MAQSNASYLLACMMLVWETTTCNKVLNAHVVQHLLKLLGHENKVYVRAEAANALRALSSKMMCEENYRG